MATQVALFAERPKIQLDVILVELLSAFEEIQFHYDAQAGDLSDPEQS